MKPKLFISYSRREMPFVNALVDRLEDDGYPVWCDYRSLVPGQPWNEQIVQGIREADLIVLVVSNAAMESKYVREEWGKMLEYNKRIVLVIFQANPLPPELQPLEWVDFRGNYDSAYAELTRQLQKAEVEASQPPTGGFKAPAGVWLAFALSVLVALISLPTVWTVITAWQLMPLPWRILKRDYNFAKVEASLFLLPLAFLVTSDLLANDIDLDNLMYGMVFFSILPAGLLWLVLRSPTLQRWGKPAASRPRFANPIMPSGDPEPVRFHIEHAPQDAPAANTLAAVLAAHGHQPQPSPQAADTVLTLVSTYNTATAADPEKQVVLPIILDNTLDIASNLKRIQWTDFRRGLNNLEALARLLCTPMDMLKALGIVPAGNQTVLPGVVQALVYFLGLLGILNVAGWVPYFIQFADDILYTPGLGGTLALFAGLMLAFLALVVFTIRALVSRRGRLASLAGLAVVFVLLGLILLVQSETSYFIEDAIWLDFENDLRGLTGTISQEVFLYGGALMALYTAFKWRDLRHWLPHRPGRAKSG